MIMNNADVIPTALREGKVENAEHSTLPMPSLERPFHSSFDLKHLQSILCGSFDQFASLQEKIVPPPAGVITNGVVRNGAMSSDVPLLKYTSAGESVATLYQTFEYGIRRNKMAPCLGRRKSAASSYTWKTYESIQTESRQLGVFLKGLGITPGERVGLSGKNAPEYLTAIQGCFWAGAITVPIHNSFSEKECKYILKQTEVQVVFVSKENLEMMVTWAKVIPSIKKIVVWGCQRGFKLPVGSGDMVVTYEACLERFAESDPIISSPPKPEDLAIIMYTSGTTGMPKGVMLPHSAIVATIASMERYFILVGGGIEADDVFMSHLSLAHVFDFFCECFFLFRGAKIGYSQGNMTTLLDDIGVLQPTIFVGVPRVFEKIYKRVTRMINNGSRMKQMLFNYFYDSKLAALNNGVKFDKAHFIGDSLVFHKFKAQLGGKVRFICSEGAPLPRYLEDWLKVTMCCPIVQGYGLTETCAVSCVSMPDRNEQRGSVGPPLFSVECKLDALPDTGYDGSPENGGEICLRGPSMMTGYYQKADITKQVLKDGWFHTGDVGKVLDSGCIEIVDRKKELLKLSQGEYISPEKVEGIAAKSQLIRQIWIHGTSTEVTLIAVIVPSEEACEKYGGKEEACKSQELQIAVLEDLEKVCHSEGLKGYEIPKAVLFDSNEWTPESGFITPSFKLKRTVLRKHFNSDIARLYASIR